MNKYIKSDKVRTGGAIPSFQLFMRKAKCSHGIINILYRILYKYFSSKRCIEIPWNLDCGYGLYIGHAYCITINPAAKIGNNCNIHRGVLIGQENRGKRKGVPVIGNEVWIGINSTIVGAITIGDDVLIAPNTYVNCDIPSHSIVFGNPCIIKHKDNATEGYINRKVMTMYELTKKYN